jgi:FkbM family methyltransferase
MDLPKETFRDYVNALRLDLKYRYVPFRGYYRYRSHKYMRRIDPEMGLLRFIVDPRRPSLDVGANLGLFTYFLSRFSPQVHAFEPNPLPFAVLRHVADRNVTLHQVALTDQSRELELVVRKGRKGWTSNGLSVDAQREGRFAIVKVPGRRIDDLGLDPVGFIKIDVEGHELAVLRGAVATLERDRPNLFVENEYSHAGTAAQEVFDLLRVLGYQGFFLGDGVLQSLDRFSFEEYQVEPRADPRKRNRYVKNFAFLPK